MKYGLLTYLFCSLITGAASAQILGAKGLEFVAPQVNGYTNVGNPQPGEIVFDTTSNSGAGGFWGKDNTTSGWISFGGGTSTPLAPTVQRFTSGSGNYTKPPGVVYIKVKMVGGGGGGGGSGSASTAGPGGTGGNSTFKDLPTTSLSAGGGDGGSVAGFPGTGGSGGSAFTVTGVNASTYIGGTGQGIGSNAGLPSGAAQGGQGGASIFGGTGGGGPANTAGGNGAVNTGAGGGGGGGGTGLFSGAGGGSGGAIETFISTPAVSYSYNVGTSGGLGAAGFGGYDGGAGGSGYIEVTEYYQ